MENIVTHTLQKAKPTLAMKIHHHGNLLNVLLKSSDLYDSYYRLMSIGNEHAHIHRGKRQPKGTFPSWLLFSWRLPTSKQMKFFAWVAPKSFGQNLIIFILDSKTLLSFFLYLGNHCQSLSVWFDNHKPVTYGNFEASPCGKGCSGFCCRLRHEASSPI